MKSWIENWQYLASKLRHDGILTKYFKIYSKNYIFPFRVLCDFHLNVIIISPQVTPETETANRITVTEISHNRLQNFTKFKNNFSFCGHVNPSYVISQKCKILPSR